LKLLAIVGPTASGKSAQAILIAQRINGEIVSADSMQAYRGLDIGTATPTLAERGGVRHHMLDEWEMMHPLTVVEFRDRARAAIEQVAQAGYAPILVGGSGLYVRAITEEFDFPGTDPAIRAAWEDELSVRGAAGLHAVLAERDPQAAAHIEPTNGRRIVRALEVLEITDRPFQARLPEPQDVYPTLRIGVRIDRQILDQRIEQRVNEMWAAGFVEEVASLLAQGLATSPTASRALGYAAILDYLAGRCSEQEAKNSTIRQTRTFARRQQRWFGRDHRITWIDHDDPMFVDRVAEIYTAT
jgi:tRNA dimethylallyltransferase